MTSQSQMSAENTEAEPAAEEPRSAWEIRAEELRQPGRPMPGPWTWEIHDYSQATLCGGGEDAIVGHIMSVSPCRSCADRAKERGSEWEWGRCLTPTLENAQLIAAAPDMFEALRRGAVALHNTVLALTTQLSPDHEDALEGAKALALMDAALSKATGDMRSDAEADPGRTKTQRGG